MSTKNSPGEYDCFADVADDEPFFVLRANDPLAANIVNNWISMRVSMIMQGVKPNELESWAKVQEAIKCRNDMIAWLQNKNAPLHEQQGFVAPANESKPN